MTAPTPPAGATGQGTGHAGASRQRLLLAAVLAVLALAAGWLLRPVTPQLGSTSTGDAELVAAVRAAELPGDRLAVVLIDGDSTRQAYFAATDASTFEIGSISKAMTGQLLAVGVERGELALQDPLGRYLEVGNGPVAGVTMRELATHHSGLPRLAGGFGSLLRGIWAQLTATDPYHGGVAELEAAAREAELGEKRYEYSNLGAGLAGQATAAAARQDYPTLARQRLFEPLGMTDTAVQDGVPLVRDGLDLAGRSQQPWASPGSSPAGGVVSTAADLTRYSRALLAGEAPGMTALQPVSEASDDNRIGLFWHTSRYPDSEASFAWHNGATGGYSSFLAVDRQQLRSVIVLSGVSDGATELGRRLLTDPALWSAGKSAAGGAGG